MSQTRKRAPLRPHVWEAIKLMGVKCQATMSLFRRLAYDQGFFESVIELQKKAKQITSEDLKSVEVWVASILQSDHPCAEEQTFYASDSASTHRKQLKALQTGQLEPLYKKALHNKNAEKLFAEVERCFHVTYILCAVYECCQLPHNPREWLHHPAYALALLPDAIQCGNIHIYLGAYMKAPDITGDTIFRELRELVQHVPHYSDTEQVNAYFDLYGNDILDQSRELWHKACSELLATCLDMRVMLRATRQAV